MSTVASPEPSQDHHDHNKKEKKGVLALPFVLSVILHVSVFLFVGSVIIFEGSIPKTLFSGDYMEAGDVSDMAMPEDNALDDVPMDNPMEVPTAESAVESGLEETITVDAPSTFSVASTHNPTNDLLKDSLSAPVQVKMPEQKKNSNPAKDLMFDSAPRKRSSIQFFGIKHEAARVAFLIDISRSMVEERKGGLENYKKLKSRVAAMIQGLNEETAFDVIMFGTNLDVFQPKLVPATPEFKQQAIAFLDPYMSTPAIAEKVNVKNNFSIGQYGLKNIAGGTSRMDMAVTACFQMGVDAIFLISDGAPAIWKKLDGKEKEDYDKANQAVRDYEAKKIDIKEAEKIIKSVGYDEAMPSKRDAWKAKVDADRAAGKVISSESPPGFPLPRVEQKDIIDHINDLYKQMYEVNGREPPVINCVGYMNSKNEGEFMKDLARKFKGKYESIDSVK